MRNSIWGRKGGIAFWGAYRKSSMSTVMSRSLSAKPSKMLKPLGCRAKLYASSAKVFTSSLDLQHTAGSMSDVRM